MNEVPSLFVLCIKNITMTLTHGYHHLQDIFELPSDLLDGILIGLPPLALQNIHDLSAGGCGKEFATNSMDNARKRGRYDGFNDLWKILFKKRWPECITDINPVKCATIQDGGENCKIVKCNHDWQQLYWEAHLQNCLNEAAERALLPSFDGDITELSVTDGIMASIGHTGCMTPDYSKLSYHCNKFGCYARSLRLQSVCCIPQLCSLLRTSKLQALVFRRIASETHVNGLCMLLNQNRETLSSLEFVHCRLSPIAMDQIFSSLYQERIQGHGIQHFSVKSSSIFESRSSSMPAGLLSFLLSGRSLHSLYLCDTHMEAKCAEMIFDILSKSHCGLATLEMSDNNIAGWLSKVDRRCADSLELGSVASSKSLVLLNLRGNNLCKDDAEDLARVLVHLPNLRSLDISDNPLLDDGIRCLIPYFIKDREKSCSLVNLMIDNCSVSSTGVSELLSAITTVKGPFNTLSIADNDLGSSIAAPLAKFLGTSRVKVLNIEDIGLGPSGFEELGEKMPKAIALTAINISKNRGGIRAASCVSRVILQAPYVVSIDAGYNIMPPESLEIIHDAMKQATGKLERLDLSGNTYLYQSIGLSKLLDFCFRGKPVITIPRHSTLDTPYDDDP